MIIKTFGDTVLIKSVEAHLIQIGLLYKIVIADNLFGQFTFDYNSYKSTNSFINVKKVCEADGKVLDILYYGSSLSVVVEHYNGMSFEVWFIPTKPEDLLNHNELHYPRQKFSNFNTITLLHMYENCLRSINELASFHSQSLEKS